MNKYLLPIILALFSLPHAHADGHIPPPSKDVAVFFEIPVSDFDRAKGFYEKILDEKLELKEGDGWKMAFFPAAEGATSGALTKSGEYKASGEGTVVYLNGGDDLAVVLSRVEGAGGKVLFPKTLIAPGVGYIAHFLDTEGNRVGLYSHN